MIINIDDKFYLEKDSRCFTIKKRTTKKDKNGKALSDEYGYFSSLENALNKLASIKTDEVLIEGATIREYISEVRKQKEILRGIVSGE